MQESVKRKYCRKRKREVEESNGIEQCSIEGCNRKAADSGTCKTKHKGYNLCRHDGCTNRSKKGGVCIRHGAKVKTCSHEGCTKLAQKGGVCVKHGAEVKTCNVLDKLGKEEFVLSMEQ